MYISPKPSKAVLRQGYLDFKLCSIDALFRRSVPVSLMQVSVKFCKI